MKKNLLTGIAIYALTFIGFAQQPLNSSFETWTGTTLYSLASPNNWGTLNLDAFSFPRTTYQSATAPFDLTANAVLETKAGHAPAGIPDVVGGALFYNFDFFTGIGTPYTSRLQSVAFRYKANHLNTDTSFVYMEFNKWNTGTLASDLIGAGFSFITSNPTEWTMMNVPIEYIDATTTPDSVALLFQVSAGSWPFGIIDYPAQVGSTLQIDGVVFCQEITAGFTPNIVDRIASFTSSSAATGNGGAGAVSWDFGDGNTSNDANPTHTYAINGDYSVVMSVIDSCGNQVDVNQTITIDSDLAVTEFLNNSTFSMFPNPSATDVNVHLTLNKDENILIELYDVAGRKVADLFSGVTSDVKLVVESSILERGVYTVKVTSLNGGFMQKQLVVTK
jgi:hypothetical protein